MPTNNDDFGQLTIANLPVPLVAYCNFAKTLEGRVSNGRHDISV